MKFYRCGKCGKIVCIVEETSAALTCCGGPMHELVAGSSDGAYEKHVPVMACEDGYVWVKVGSAEHPMTESHHIDWIAVETQTGCQFKRLKPCCYPEALFALVPHEKVLHVYAYCNLHGLWQN